MNTFKKILLSALLVCGGVCAMNAQEKTTTAGVPLVTLNNGVEMPRFGLGTFLQGSNEICRQSCLTALKAGYRHIDTAHAYNDEEGVGQAVKESGIPREEIWITSKLWPNEYGEGKTLKAIDDMLKRLQLDYIDLLYVHQPFGDFVGAWKDMEKAVKMGKVRALGISNFDANEESRQGRHTGRMLVPFGRRNEQWRTIQRPRHQEDSRSTWQVAGTNHPALAHSGRFFCNPRSHQSRLYQGEHPDIRLRPHR